MIITDIKNLKKKFLGNYKLFRDDYIINQHVIKNKKHVFSVLSASIRIRSTQLFYVFFVF